MVLDDTMALPELVDGAVAAAIGATAATLTMIRSPVRFAARRGWVRLWWRPLTQFVLDLPTLVRVLGRALMGGTRDPGGLRAIAFTIEPDGAMRAGQVALASVAGSFAPNSIVVAVDEPRGTLIVHELEPRSASSSGDPLGLG
jgi:hypothetical protein